MIKFERIDISEYFPSCPEDVVTIDDGDGYCERNEDGTLDISIVADAIAMLREAKERHLPVLITNQDKSRALLIKDANDLKGHISVNGIPFCDI